MKTFQFKAINTVLLLIVVGVSLSLAYWQFQRITEKEELQRAHEQLKLSEPWKLNSLKAEEFERLTEHFWQPVSAQGQFLREFAFFLDSQVFQGKPGYHYIVPLKLDDHEHAVLINLGWLPAGNRQKLPEFPNITTPQPIVGQLASPKKAMPGFEQFDPTSKTQLFINIEQLSDRIGHPLLPMIVQLNTDAKGSLKREWPAFKANVKMHQFYVFHWLAVALAASQFTSILVLSHKTKIPRRQSKNERSSKNHFTKKSTFYCWTYVRHVYRAKPLCALYL